MIHEYHFYYCKTDDDTSSDDTESFLLKYYYCLLINYYYSRISIPIYIDSCADSRDDCSSYKELCGLDKWVRKACPLTCGVCVGMF